MVPFSSPRRTIPVRMNALLVLDKPQGLSSHSAVQQVRQITGEDRAGHAGTLDPLATGVLLVLLGSAVRLAEYIVAHDKRYRATIRLGVETDTYDATGTVTATHPFLLEPGRLEDVLASFLGAQNQIPPAHSAVQVQGKRAYKLARRGVVLELEPRPVEIYTLDLVSAGGDTLVLDVHCSKGTYIRSLAHDLGARLGTGGHLAALRRTASGQFTLAQSATLDSLRAAVEAGNLAAYLLAPDLAVSQFDALNLDAASARAVQQGRFLSAPPHLTTPLVRAYDEQWRLIAILERDGAELKPKKVLEP